MTFRAVGTVVLAGGLVVLGWHSGWPELTALGAAGLTLVVVAVAWAGPRPRASVGLERLSLRVVRGEPAWVRIAVRSGQRRRWLRLVEGAPHTPSRSIAVPAAGRGQEASLKVPLDTSRRGQRPIGPYSLVHGDPWAMVRRVVASADGGIVTVLPRVHPLPRSLLSTMSVDDSSLSSRHAGDHHFHALRDYVLGDEPRTIHWRSTARAGHLVVRQQVAAATNGTTVVLDCDTSAYGSDERFGTGWVADRFEAAVEVAASLCVANVGREEQVHLMTSTRGAAPISPAAGSTGTFLDALAVVSAVAPVETLPEGLPALVRRTRCARAVIVTGTPGPAIVDATRRIRRAGTSTLVIRVGSQQRADLAGLRVVDIDRPEELV